MADTAWWIVVVLMMAAGLAGTVLPALPGTLLIFAGAVLGAWIDGFARVGAGTLTVLGVLTLLSWGLEYAAGLMGARRVGASREALIGAAVGTVAGLLAGLIGVLFLPLVGAAVGEWLALSRRGRAGTAGAGVAATGRRAVAVGVATWIGMMVGLVAKVVIAFTMVGLFAVAVWL